MKEPSTGSLIASLAITITLLCGYAWGSYALNKKAPEGNMAMKPEVTIEEENINGDVFAPGEHIISVPYQEVIKERNAQMPYHEGYEVLSLSMDFGGRGSILYVNTDTVICTATGMNEEGNYVYSDFGTPQNPVIHEENDGITIFDTGEHVIAKPISNPTDDNQQYPTQEGYEVIGMDFYTTNTSGFYGGGWVLYRNTTPVVCVKTDGEYNTFGTPIENNKELTR